MSHSLVIAIPGQPGGNKTGHRGIYECKCGEQFLGIDAHRKHRSTILRNEAIERMARALMRLEYDATGNNHIKWEDIQEDVPSNWRHTTYDINKFTRVRYREWATTLYDAAKVRR